MLKCNFFNASTTISILNHISHNEDHMDVYHSQIHYIQWTFGLFAWEKKWKMMFWGFRIKGSKVCIATHVNGPPICYI
jgi:hypothetical protein